MNTLEQSICIGAHYAGGLVTLAPDERRRHLYLIGQTGTGKSTMLLNLIRQDLENDAGLALLDPHGDLAFAALQHVPHRRINDLVYIDPADIERPIGFNPLAHVPDPLKPVVADGVVAAFRHVWPDSWGPRLDYILTSAVRALLDVPGATLLMLPRLLIDDAYRIQMIDRHVSDPVVRAFWLNEYAAYSPSFRVEAIAPIQNKIGKALMVPSLRNMLAQPTSTITLRRLMDERAIVIVNLSKGALGESTAHLLGALLTTAIAQAALSRVDVAADRRIPFHLYADEFQSFATESFALILSEARKYALTLTIAHQYLDQLPDRLRSAVFGNVGAVVACRTGATDAPILAEQIGLGGADALLDLANFSAWARMLRGGVPSSPIRLNLHAAPPPRRTSPDRLVQLNRMRFGRPRGEVEARIARFLAG
jgi:Helicase HerA, central domain